MKKSIAVLLLTVAAATCVSARTLEVTEGAYELSLGEFNVPRSRVGTASFRICSTCETVALSVTTRTLYEISGRAYDYPDFIELVTKIRQRDGGNSTTDVSVFFGLDSKLITKIAVFPQN